MKIYVSQGHEEGIGLEVFFKTCLFLSDSDLKLLQLIAFKQSVKETLISLQLPFELSEDSIEVAHKKIPVIWLDQISHSQSFTCLELGMRLSEGGGILYTLPTSKDQFPGFAGHTEYFRHFYRRPELGMFFSSPTLKVLLVTDHVAISELTSVINDKRVFDTLLMASSTLKKWNWPVGKFIVSGLNPHAGEGGLIGSEDGRISSALKRLKNEKKLDVTGPFPGDTMLREQKSPEDVLVYLFHDQGLGVFKGLQGLVGSNITLGLPYPRFSPDHGTSFNLFGKNEADYRGCRYSLKEAITLFKRMSDGQNSSNKSKSSQSKKY